MISVLTITAIGYIITERGINVSKRNFHEMTEFANAKFNITHSVHGFRYKYLFIIDNENHNVIIMRSITDIQIIPFRNIEGVELLNDENVVGRSSIRSSLGAIVGGSLTGASGAIIGALPSALRNRRGVAKIAVSIKNKDFSYSTLLCLDSWEATNKTKKYLRSNERSYKNEYKDGVQRAKRIIKLIIPIIENNYKHQLK